MSDKVSAKQVIATYWEISERLKKAHIWHRGEMDRYDGVTIVAHVPGEYWEIDILEDVSIDFEIYQSKDGVFGGLAELNQSIEHVIELNKE